MDDNRIAALRLEARRELVAWAKGIIAQHDAQMLGGFDLEACADVLLMQLEPMIAQYAPPPARIVEALRYGNQSGGGSGLVGVNDG